MYTASRERQFPYKVVALDWTRVDAPSARVAFKLPLSSQSSCICRMGRKVVRMLSIKLCCFLLINFSNPHTLEELKENITREIQAVSEQEIFGVNQNLFRRYIECVLVKKNIYCDAGKPNA